MIDILLATFNSEKYLEAQLDSILNQSYQEFNIIISDDGSIDKTLELIRLYQSKFNDKISLLPTIGNLGAMKNFNYLLQNVKSEYIAFADHDDIWHKDKLKLSIEEIKKIEGEERYQSLVFTDKAIVDENLNMIASSSCKAEKLNCGEITLNRLLVQNVASGCTIMINRKMKLIIDTIPDEAIMHDHYMMLIAKIFGKISFINLPLMLYRQHAKNEIGAKKYGLISILQKFKKNRSNINYKFLGMVDQSIKILDIYNDDKIENLKQKISSDNLYKSNIIFSNKDKDTLKNFNRLKTANFFQFKYILLRYRFLKSGFLRKVGMCLLLSRKN